MPDYFASPDEALREVGPSNNMNPDFLKTDRKESFSTWRFRMLMNWYPMYFGTGGKVLFWSADSSEVHLRLKLNLWTYNYVGTIFGGSLFAAADPFYMVMLMRILGSGFVVWDKTATIKFKKPGKKRLFALLKITPGDLHEIRSEVGSKGEMTRTFTIRWLDKDQTVYAEIERHCYIADREFYLRKKGETQKARF